MSLRKLLLKIIKSFSSEKEADTEYISPILTRFTQSMNVYMPFKMSGKI